MTRKEPEPSSAARLRHILAKVSSFCGVEPLVTPLSGGITNENYRVEVGEQVFVLRIGGEGTHLLGISRQNEHECSTIAAELGIGAEVVEFIESEGVLLTRFIHGKNLTQADAAMPELLPRVVASLRRYHQGPAFPGRFSPFEVVRSYSRLSAERGVAAPKAVSDALALMAQIEGALGRGGCLHPCHNDLLAQNFIDDGSTLRILDWEYAGMGDIFFDLGNFVANQELDEAGRDDLLRAYFGEVLSSDVARLHLMRLSSDLRESFWGLVQAGISTLDMDYMSYAQKHLERFLSNAETPEFHRWLSEARGAERAS